MEGDDRAHISDLESVWTALRAFFDPFTDVEWARPHGSDWVYADIPYHLSIYNRLTADAILRGKAGSDSTPALISLDQLNQWNQARQRELRQVCPLSAAYERMIETQEMVRGALHTLPSLDSPVWLMTLRARGWRTARLAVDFLQWHTWLHLVEAALRYQKGLPLIAPAAVRRAVAFEMEMLAGRVSLARAAVLLAGKPFTWALEITLPESGTAEWTLTIDPTVPNDGVTQVCTVSPGFDASADVTTRAELTTYLRVMRFNLIGQTLAGLTGKFKHQGSVSRLQAIITPTPNQIWTPMEREKVPHGDR